MPFLPDFLFTEELIFFILIGFAAQFVDGFLGMAYGISANTLLIGMGISPVQASASIHIAELFTTSVSGFSHYGFGNVDIPLVKKLILPGVIGATTGAIVLVWMPLDIMKVLVACYLLVMGGTILYKAYKNHIAEQVRHHVVPLGFLGGFLDAAGGGGWGTIVASSLVAKGSIPRLAIGTVNAAEFFIAFASSLVFIVSINTLNWTIVVGLALGGALSAPLAAYFARHMPAKRFMVVIGIVIMILSSYIIFQVVL